MLLALGIKKKDILVISPYVAMASYLSQILGKHTKVVVASTLDEAISVSSVGSLQGCEGLVGILAT